MNTDVSVPSYQSEVKDLIKQLGDMLPAESLNTFNQDAEQLAQTYAQPLKRKVGEQAPGFSLANAQGKTVTLSEMLGRGSVVLAFYRGTWCPYCNLQLKQYQQILAQIQALGGNLVAISPQNPDQSLSMQEKNELQFEVLSDAGNTVAEQYTTVFRNGDAPVEVMQALGIDFDSFYEEDSRGLPVPAVFVIHPNGQIIFAQSEGGDYRGRVEPQAILQALKMD